MNAFWRYVAETHFFILFIFGVAALEEIDL